MLADLVCPLWAVLKARINKTDRNDAPLDGANYQRQYQ